MSNPNYNVCFGEYARTLLYKDAEGEILFTYDLADSDDNKTLALERIPKNMDIWQKTSSGRIELAFHNAKQYLLSCGYQVKIWPDEFE